MTPLGRHIEARRAELGYDTHVAFIEHARLVNGGDGFARGAFGNWLTQPGIKISTRMVRRLARALAADSSAAAYQRELNTINDLLGRPSEAEEDELDIDPELIRQLGPAGRRFIEEQIAAVVRLRRDIWAERGPSTADEDS